MMQDAADKPNIVQVTPELLAAARAWMTPKRLEALDAMTDDDIAAQIASNPDAAPELDDAWFARATYSKAGVDGLPRTAIGRWPDVKI